MAYKTVILFLIYEKIKTNEKVMAEREKKKKKRDNVVSERSYMCLVLQMQGQNWKNF